MYLHDFKKDAFLRKLSKISICKLRTHHLFEIETKREQEQNYHLHFLAIHQYSALAGLYTNNTATKMIYRHKCLLQNYSYTWTDKLHIA